jgi:DeoR/GlpR family transcriptional regulator of sugar metabolism
MAFIPAQRQQKILELLQERKTLKIHELVDQFKVSPMTIHRDLRHLNSAGLATKTHGGVTLARGFPTHTVHSNSCALCGNPVPTRTALIIHGSSGESIHTCCPHCGLILLARQEGSLIAMTADFLYGQMASVQEAIYLVESTVSTCCTPSVLSFIRQKDAQRFQQGFGGQVMNFDQAQQYVQDAMVMGRKQHPSVDRNGLSASCHEAV